MHNPFVSIIIPVCNNLSGLEKALASISKQTYPDNKFEVIVVDNGSDVCPDQIAQKHGALYIVEHDFLNSPYSARNRGIEIARGQVLVLLDTTCTVVPDWLESGIAEILNGNDIVGGDIVFDIDERSDIGEIYDSLLNVRMKNSVLNRGVAKTGNLFIRKKVFEGIGFFPEGVRSGADVSWTKKAVKNGFNLSFCENAKAVIKPRGVLPLIKKQYRVAKGQVQIWREHGEFYRNFFKKGILCFLPPIP